MDVCRVDWEILLEFTRILLSPHIVIAAVLLYLVLKFRGGLGEILQGLAPNANSGGTTKTSVSGYGIDINHERNVAPSHHDELEDSLKSVGSVKAGTGAKKQSEIQYNGDLPYMDLGDSLIRTEIEQKIRNELEEKDVNTDNPAAMILIRNLAQTSLDLAFEQNYYVFRGSEIRLLREMNSRVSVPFSVMEIDDIIIELTKINPSIFTGMTCNVYLAWLLKQNLVIEVGSEYGITVRGQAFLVWLTKNNKNERLAN